jgi:hypothetical protein
LALFWLFILKHVSCARAIEALEILTGSSGFEQLGAARCQE